MEVNEIVKVINEVLEVCRDNSFCNTCPYWNKNTKECKIHMESKADNAPEFW